MQAVKLVTPTDIPATAPPPSVPTLDLSGLKILDDPGIGGNTLIARTALRHYGEYYRPDGVPWVGWCEMFAGDVLAEAGIAHARYASAIEDAIAAPLYRGSAPAGSLVFFDQRASPYGHVGISLGDGTMLSALGGGVVRTSYQDWTSYLGWRPYGTTTPNDASFTLHTYETATFTDDPSLAWGANGVAIPDDASPGLVAHTNQVLNDLPARLAPPLSDDWDAPPPYRTPRQAMK
jgi:hypothetical protein